MVVSNRTHIGAFVARAQSVERAWARYPMLATRERKRYGSASRTVRTSNTVWHAKVDTRFTLFYGLSFESIGAGRRKSKRHGTAIQVDSAQCQDVLTVLRHGAIPYTSPAIGSFSITESSARAIINLTVAASGVIGDELAAPSMMAALPDRYLCGDK